MRRGRRGQRGRRRGNDRECGSESLRLAVGVDGSARVNEDMGLALRYGRVGGDISDVLRRMALTR